MPIGNVSGTARNHTYVKRYGHLRTKKAHNYARSPSTQRRKVGKKNTAERYTKFIPNTVM